SGNYYDGKCDAPFTGTGANNNLTTNIVSIPGPIDSSKTVVGALKVDAIMSGSFKSAKLTGSDGEIILKPSPTSNYSLKIPAGATVTGPNVWDGIIQAPSIVSNKVIEKAGGLIIKAGASNNSSLQFDKSISITLDVSFTEGSLIKVYVSNDLKNFQEFQNVPVINGKVTITTNHLTYFVLKGAGSTTTGTGTTQTGTTQTGTIIFTDIQDSFAYEQILKLYTKGVIGGYDDKTFRPNNNVTRAEFLKMVMRGLDVSTGDYTSTDFSDVTESWMIPYIMEAKKLGIVNGQDIVDNKTKKSVAIFRPNDSITRAEAIKILLKAKGIEIPTVLNSSFTDIKETWMISYAEKAKELGIIDGQTVDDKLIFRPNYPITRAESSKIIVNMMEQ
ncbi:MAG: S-layer homology domain-containing protein, partial [Candidatus Gracilibacteria bacterium]|nr:S-layer homology domain-containing protein [Candidatus Gracilibacteria bacterium]